jgi:predicted ATP-grasp superfamily ATP-dependent carboligase
MPTQKRGEEGVLIVDAASGCSLTCARSLGARGVKTVVAATQRKTPVTSSRYCDESVVVTAPRDDLLAYRDELLELAARPEIRTIIPGKPEDSYVLSRFLDQFEEHVSLPVPSMSTLRAVHDRHHLATVAEDAGVPVPETRLLATVDDWTDELIVKSRYNVLTDAYIDAFGPSDAAVVKDIHHLGSGAEPDYDSLCASMRHEPIVQEFIPTDGEYMFAGLYDHGEPLATFQHRQIRGNSYTGGGGVYRRSVSIPELETVARTLLGELDWHGLACIEYMRDDRTGEFVLTEINPRMWQSLPSTVRAGGDFPLYYWLQATDRADEIDPTYDLGVGTHLLRGELDYLTSVVTDDSPHVSRPSLTGSLAEILVSCALNPNFDYLRLDDPVPFLKGIWNELSKSLPPPIRE